jgi:hypothetical protein
MTFPAFPSDVDHSASLTAVGMGEMIAAMDALVSCYESSYPDAGVRVLETLHEKRSDGSCRCGKFRPSVTVQRKV